METLRTATELGQLPAGCVLSIGNFDGVHLGHRRILDTAHNTASRRGAATVVMTFEPHPVAILHPEKAPVVLTPLPLKIHLLKLSGIVDYLIVLRDTASLLSLSAGEFVDRFLAGDVRPGAVVEGEDFHFGAGRSGTVDILRDAAAGRGFEVVVVPAEQRVLPTGQIVRVSSTLIRYMLESGHVADAGQLLGRAYRLIGQVVRGKGRGKELGYPTLNMQVPNQVVPAEGVYAGFAYLAAGENEACSAAEKRPAVFSIGQAITFGDVHPLLIEAHLLDTVVPEGASEWLAMDFVERLRSQHKFKAADELVSQITKDCESARSILA